MLLNGFGFSGYRSFGDELTKISPLRKVNLIIGQNNVGKSNIVNFLYHQYPFFLSKINGQPRPKEQGVPFKDIDKSLSSKNAPYRISFPILKSDIKAYIDEVFSDRDSHSRGQEESAEKLLSSDHFSDEKGDIWFTYKTDNLSRNFELEIDLKKVSKVLKPYEWQELWSSLTRNSGGDIDRHWIPDTIKVLSYFPSQIPNIEIIPAIRQVGAAGSQAKDYSGEGIIERLAKIQNPSLTDQSDKEKFISINKFVQTVLENQSAEIEIPHERDMVLVHMDDRTLPLESLGTGVHEVIILASAATLLEETVLCVEEPELHLHPLLQKKLVKYLAENTTNQYFFTTHSAHLLDAVEAEIFHVTQYTGTSSVTAVASTKEKSNICNDLGYKASDLLQANCIIWVEGPSDRIYIKYWISAKNPELIEGVHYSIMFYGGRLFSHLTALDDEESNNRLEDFISVRNLNRNTVIMFDSDKNKPRAHLNPTKRRLKSEFDAGPGFAWITDGREIENYLDYDQVEKSVISVHPSAKELISKGKWENLLKYKKKRTYEKKCASKVKVAKHYVENNSPDLNVFDLNKRISQLCDFICWSNNLEN